ncbi:MAG: hypothetical protein B6U86_03040 [Candidatus Altiarchaeales archaeon ex4484_43]|nr:MAG: hypothetical protein B6U86_03040 [Candidatus Altiarchaeales archaeon ex4484_43]RLI89118.1 MAG: hypothetical protein DRO62_02310 [Candidatus Altiarchaeales archaeon]
MDSLFHFVFALVGGYVFVKAVGFESRFLFLVLLALLSEFPDVSHLMGNLALLHNIFIFVPLLLLFLFFHKKGKKNLQIYMVTFMIMVYGHLLADMIFGIGIPLFFPLSAEFYLIPQMGLCMYDGSFPHIMYGSDLVECFFAPSGVALTLYFGVIGILALVKNYLFSK